LCASPITSASGFQPEIRIYVLQKRPGWERDPVICQKIKKLQALEALEDEAWVWYQPIVDRIAKLEGQSKLDLAEQQELCELEARMGTVGDETAERQSHRNRQNTLR